ncbi:hypothetical protein KSZ_41040 [Dictyobacter formicarum]|uniref:NADP-dependent oxidoreductase domain-containing protein n=2 Tax=Dictyobacter formicarum TaxID=2778368 RepID=A0ABQ3VJU7_9CHLR|nr:hypothetical protein KSZ_41040 [Dictyobacter formicarum]
MEQAIKGQRTQAIGLTAIFAGYWSWSHAEPTLGRDGARYSGYGAGIVERAKEANICRVEQVWTS